MPLGIKIYCSNIFDRENLKLKKNIAALKEMVCSNSKRNYRAKAEGHEYGTGFERRAGGISIVNI